ncbi:MAG: fibronectin type III domain-containing protein, partial [Bacteroidales bacterium]|nr:fibronectin type III domain-containing protein [Bacteroidales bacterium]
MKKLILLACTLFAINLSFGQLIQNGSFTNWQVENLYEYPDGWVINTEHNNINILQEKSYDAQDGNYSMLLNTANTQNGIDIGYLLYGIPNDGDLMGFPFTLIADTLRFSYKANIETGDYAMVMLILYAGGVTIDSVVMPIDVPSTSWINMSLGFNSGLVQPDSLFLGFLSGDPFGNGNPKAGTQLFIDNIYFTSGTNNTPLYPIPNSSIEVWRNAVSENPLSWITSNGDLLLAYFDTANVTKTSSYQSAPYAVKLSNIDLDGNHTRAEIKYIDNNYNYKPQDFSFYYKYEPNGSDSARVSINFFKTGNHIGGFSSKIGDYDTTYKKVEVNLNNLFEEPDRLEINFEAGENSGSILYIDEVQFGCIKPKNLFGQYTTTTSVQLTWETGALETQWQVQWGIAGFQLGNGTFVNVNNTPELLLNGLDTSSTYEYYVRSLCDTSNMSQWEGPFTICKEQNIPIAQGFENTPQGAIPMCWNKITTNGANIQVSDCCEPYSGNKFLNMNLQPYTNCVFITPYLNNNLSDLFISFAAKKNSFENTAMYLGTMTNPQDLNTFSPLNAFALMPGYNTFSYYFNNYTGNDKYIALMLTADEGYGANVLVDDIMIGFIPSCLPVQNLTAQNITTNSAEIMWQAGNNETLWNAKYGFSGYDPETQDTSIAQPLYGLTSPNFFFNGFLEEGQMYDIYVQADCGGGDVSPWTKVSFTTNCGLVNIPLFENFENTPDGNVPNCWNRITSNGSAVGVVSYYQGTSQPKSVRMHWANNTMNTYLITPQLNTPLNELQIEFNAKSQNQFIPIITLGTMSDPTDENTFNPLTNYYLTQNYQTYSYLLNAYLGSDSYLAFRLTADTNDYVEMFIDDVNIGLIPSCPKPTNIFVSNLNSNSVTLNWTAGSNEQLWHVVITPQNVPFDTNNYVYSNFNVANNMLDVIGLNQNTGYSVYVQANCGSNDLSTWAGPYNFMTPCANYTLPFSEEFGYNFYHVPTCWFRTADNWYNYPNSTVGGYYGELLYNGNYNFNTGKQRIITPFIDATAANSLMVTFKHALQIMQDTGVAPMIGIEVTTDGNNWTTAWSLVPTANINPEEIMIDLSAYAHQTIKLAWFVDGMSQEIPSWVIDNVLIDVMPTCLMPTALNATNITSNSADLSWTAGGNETIWDVKVGYQGFSPHDTMNYLQSQTGLTNNFWTVQGLNPMSIYDFYVKADCDSGDVSTWAGPYNFSTICNFAQAPYLQNFETSSLPQVPLCNSIENAGQGNNWQTIYNPNSDFPDHTLYYLPNMSPANAWYFTQGIELTGGTTYKIGFRYGNNTPAWTESLRVMYGKMPNSASMTSQLLDFFSINQAVPQNALQYFTPDSTGIYYFGFNCYSAANQYYLFVDDIVVDVAPACQSPVNLLATNITSNSADLLWDASGSASYFEIEWGEKSLQFGYGNYVDVSNNSYSLFGVLTPATQYRYYIRALCNNGADTSEWAGPYYFTTLCDAVSEFFENFDATNNFALPVCFKKVTTTGNTYTYSQNAYSWPNNLDMNANDSSDFLIVSLPKVNNAGDDSHWLKFWAKGNTNANIEVGYLTDPQNPNSFILIQTVQFADNNYNKYVINPGILPNNTVFAFKHTGNPSGLVSIDDVSWEAKPQCPGPDMFSVMVSNITSNTFDISWTDLGNATQWAVNYGQAGQGFTQTTYTNTNAITLTNLVAFASYQFQIQSICSQDTSEWKGPFYNFSGSNFSCFPGAVYGQNPEPMEYSLWSSQDFGRKVHQNFSGITSPFNVLHFWGRFHDTYNACTPSSIDVEVGFYEDNNGSIGTQVASYIVPIVPNPINTGYAEQYYDLTIQLPNNVTLNEGWFSVQSINSPSCYMLVLNTTNPAASGYVLRVQNQGQDTIQFNPMGFCFLYDVCPTPSNLNASNITTSSADLLWDTQNEPLWNVEVGNVGFTPGTQTALYSQNETTSNSWQLTNLSEGTTYSFYVQHDCDANGTSSWSGPYNFTTLFSCPQPYSLNAFNIQSSQADLTWMAGGSEPKWDIELGFNAFVPTGVPTQSDITNNTYTYTGLQANTTYDYYVRAHCDTFDYSIWEGPFTFATTQDCGILISNYPWYEGFEGTTFPPVCWINQDEDNDGYKWEQRVLPAMQPHTGYNLAISASWMPGPGALNPDNWLITPQLSINNPNLEFSMWYAGLDPSYVSEKFSVLISTTGTNPADFTEVFTTVATSTNYNEVIVPLDTYSGQNIYIAIRHWGCTDMFNLRIDDISVRSTLCKNPTNLTASNITSNSADLGWNQTGPTSQWNIEVGFAPGFTPGTGSPNVVGSITTSSNPWTVTGLNQGTNYAFFVQAVCDSIGVTAWVGPYVFSTLVGCPAPTALNAYNIMPNQADLSWAAGGTENNWLIEVGYPSFIPGTGNYVFFDSLMNITSLTVFNLNQSTNYEFYVKSKCDIGDVSVWSGPYSFATQAMCPNPVALSANNVQSSQAELYWSPGGSETMWVIEVGYDGFTPETYNYVLIDTLTNIQYSAQGLSPNTVYNYYVRALCGNEVSLWTGPFVFQTACNVFTAPFTETFESVTFPPDCWKSIQGSGIWHRASNVGGYNNSNASAMIDFYNISGNTPQDLITFTFNTGALSSPSLTFDYAYANYDTTLYYDQLDILTSADGGNTFTLLVNMSGKGELNTGGSSTQPFVPTTSQWATKQILLPSGTNAIKFRATSGYGNNLYIDNVTVDDNTISCPQPNTLYATSVTSNSAIVGWTAGGSEYLWNVEVGLQGFTPGTNTFVAGSANFGSVQFDATALIPSTAYEFYVQAVCDINNVSNWVGPFTFQTLSECPEPTNITVSNILPTQANATWTVQGSEVGWEIELGLSGFQPTGTATHTVASPNNSIVFSGLTPNTAYQFHIRAVCSNGYSPWIAENYFTTCGNFEQVDTISICNGSSYQWQGQVYTQSGTYYANYTTINGCDSMYVLNLEVYPTYEFNEDAAICGGQPYQWHGQVYTQAGTYNAVYSTVNGCDSIYILHLNSYPEFKAGIIGKNQTICENNAPELLINIASPSGGLAPYYYQWQQQPNCTGLWLDIPGAQADNYQPPVLSQSTCYRRMVTNICGSAFSNVIDNRLAAYWEFDNNTLDYSGNNNHGVNNGASFTSDRIGNPNNAISFSANSNVNCGNNASLQINQNFTVSMWVKTTTTAPSTNQFILSRWDNNVNKRVWGFLQRQGKNFPSLIVSTNGVDVSYIDGTTLINDGNWHQLSLVQDGSTIKFYINGIFQNQKTQASFPLNNANLLVAANNIFNGSVDDVRIYKQAFTPQQIADLYNNNIPSSNFINVNVNPDYNYVENAAICDGDSYQWQGNTYNTAGSYSFNYTGALGCDSILTLNLQVNPVYEFIEDAAICAGQSYQWHGQIYTQAGSYNAVYASVNGCDSIYYLNLDVLPVYTFEETINICNGNVYQWHGNTYSQTGIYYANYTTINGCDSIYKLILNVNPNYEFVENASICDGQSYQWHGQIFTQSGTYYANYTTINGCDSMYVLNLEVYPTYEFNEDAAICGGQ